MDAGYPRDGRTVPVREMGWIVFFLLLLQLLYPAHSCPILQEPFGNLTADQELEVGSLLMVRCSLFEEQAKKNNVSVKDLSLKLNGNLIKNVRIVNQLTLEYLVRSATVNDTGYYVCYVELPDYSAKQLVCSSYVDVGYKPLPVDSFSCISQHYLNLTCSWVAPYNSVATRYKLYDYVDRPVINRTCPVMLNASSCQFRMDTQPVYLKYQPKLHFILVGENSLGINKQYINIDHFKIVKPGVPKFVICTNVTASSLFMRWNAPKGLDYGQSPAGLLYQLKYYSVSTNLSGKKEIMKFSEEDLKIKIEDLVPNTIYEFEIRVRLNMTGDDFFWSETARHTEQTRPDVPYLAPEVTRSSFDTQIIAGNRSITLYWKAIPSEFENGDDFHYIIRYHEHYTPYRYKRDVSKKPNSWVILGNQTSQTFEYMDTDSAYIFNIAAVNHVGNSTNESSIVVDKLEKLLQGPKDILVVSYGVGNYTITWRDPNSKTTHFTVFWCQTLKSRPAKCDGPIKWMHTTKTDHHLLLYDHHTNYQFAVAANHNHQTSGMAWAPCIASYNGVRYKVGQMKLTPKNSTSLRVQWSLGCKAQEKVIQKYLISYCPHKGKCVNSDWKCEEGWSNVTVMDPSKNEYILTSLKPYTCYFSFIRVLTPSGWSENSNYAYESTMASAPSDPPTNVVVKPLPLTPDTVEIELLFEPPTTPNGIITKYKIFYNETASQDRSFHMEVPADEGVDGHYQVPIGHLVRYFTNYSVEVVACVHQACSDPSPPEYVYTGISTPSSVKAPRVELSDSVVNITWDPPDSPNGPVDFYEVELYSNETHKSQHFRVNASSSLALRRECDVVDPDESVYNFRVRAVNVEEAADGDDKFLYGGYSRPTKMVFCPSGKSVAFIAGVVAGIIFICVIFLGGGMYCFHKCRGEYLERKNIKIKLPLELETPFGNPLNSFDKLKNGLHKSTPDSSIPCDRAYERLCSFAQESNQTVWNEANAPSHRNNSGESHKSGLSSADTTHTMVSMDSSAEHECGTTESDSSDPSHSEGAAAEDLDQLTSSLTPQIVTQNANTMTFSRCFVRPRRPTTPLAGCDELGMMPYCKFSALPGLPSVDRGSKNESVVKPESQSKFSAENFLQNLYKINSEPSLYAYDNGDIESVSTFDVQPYSKVGLTRSNTHLCESSRPNNVGYSRFGATFSPYGVPYNPEIFTVFVPPSGPLPVLTHRDKSAVPILKKTTAGRQAESNDAYSKFGVGKLNTNKKNYVAFDDVPYVCRTFDLGGNAAPVSLTTASGPRANSSHANTQPQETLDDQDDPRSFSEMIAEDEDFSVPSSRSEEPFPVPALGVGTENLHKMCNGELFSVLDCADNIGDTETLPLEENNAIFVANNTEQDFPCETNNQWGDRNGSATSAGSFSLEQYEDLNAESEPAPPQKGAAASSNYLPLSELAKQKVTSPDLKNAIDAPNVNIS